MFVVAGNGCCIRGTSRYRHSRAAAIGAGEEISTQGIQIFTQHDGGVVYPASIGETSFMACQERRMDDAVNPGADASGDASLKRARIVCILPLGACTL